MNVMCQDCQSIFRVDPARVPPNGVRARCSVCGAIVRITLGATTPLTNLAVPSRIPTSLQTPVATGTPSGGVRLGTPAFTGASAGAPPHFSRPTPSVSTPGIFAAGQVAHVAAASTPVRVPSPPGGFNRPSAASPVTSDAAPILSANSSSALPMTSMATPASSADVAQSPRIVAPFTARPLVPPPPPSPGQMVGMIPPAPQPLSQPTIAPASGAAPRRVINPFLRSDPMTRAKRLARALVSDMVAYQPAKRADGLANGTLKQLFRDEIRKSYDEYVEQVGRDVAESTAFFQDALNEVLAEGKRVF